MYLIHTLARTVWMYMYAPCILLWTAALECTHILFWTHTWGFWMHSRAVLNLVTYCFECTHACATCVQTIFNVPLQHLNVLTRDFECALAAFECTHIFVHGVQNTILNLAAFGCRHAHAWQNVHTHAYLNTHTTANMLYWLWWNGCSFWMDRIVHLWKIDVQCGLPSGELVFFPWTKYLLTHFLSRSSK